MNKLMFAAALILAATPYAQERAAGGTAETQMTWSALKALTDDANANSKAAHTRIDQLEACGKIGKLYAPGHDKASKDGCVNIGNTAVQTFVPATNRYYQPSGVTVKKGQSVTMKVTGKVSWARAMPATGLSSHYFTASDRPDATGQKYAKYNPICPLRYTIYNSVLHADVYDYSGTSYCAKNDLVFKAAANGEIYVGIPEGGSNTGDNNGGFMISITTE